MHAVTCLERGLYILCWSVCLVCMVAIAVALSAQIVARYVFGLPLQYTDDVAEIALVWMSFTGAALLFHEGGHIAVAVVPDALGDTANAVRRIAIALLVIGALLLVLVQIRQIMPTLSRIGYGSLPPIPWFSKFHALFLPLGLGSLVTIVFAGAGIARDVQRLCGRRPGPGQPAAPAGQGEETGQARETGGRVT